MVAWNAPGRRPAVRLMGSRHHSGIAPRHQESESARQRFGVPSRRECPRDEAGALQPPRLQTPGTRFRPSIGARLGSKRQRTGAVQNLAGRRRSMGREDSTKSCRGHSPPRQLPPRFCCSKQKAARSLPTWPLSEPAVYFFSFFAGLHFSQAFLFLVASTQHL